MVVIEVLLPFVLAGLLHHLLVIKKNWFPGLARPLDGGRTWRGKRWLGDNKTWRGIWVMTLGTGMFFVVENWLWPLEWLRISALAAGMILGLGYAGAELLNSFAKRQFDIAPGEKIANGGRSFFKLLDQTDSVLGSALLLPLVTDVEGKVIVAIIVAGSLIHWGVDTYLHRRGYKHERLATASSR